MCASRHQQGLHHSWHYLLAHKSMHAIGVQNVLKGIFPVMVGGACCHYAFILYKMYWTRKFVDPPPYMPLRKIFKFEYPGGALCCGNVCAA